MKVIDFNTNEEIIQDMETLTNNYQDKNYAYEISKFNLLMSILPTLNSSGRDILENHLVNSYLLDSTFVHNLLVMVEQKQNTTELIK
jgi:hypothetical protein